MNDTQILNSILEILDTNANADWVENDPVEEFNAMAQFITAERSRQAVDIEEKTILINGIEIKDCIGLHHDD
mgnify:FL=1